MRKNNKYKLLALAICTLIFSQSSIVKASTTLRETGQDVTFYVSIKGSPTASGVQPSALDVAVHPNVYYVNGWNSPILPFGTVITTDKDIIFPLNGGTAHSSMYFVRDTGELNNEHYLSRYWFDIWCGTYSGSTSDPNYVAAKNAGTLHNVSYYAYIP